MTSYAVSLSVTVFEEWRQPSNYVFFLRNHSAIAHALKSCSCDAVQGMTKSWVFAESFLTFTPKDCLDLFNTLVPCLRDNDSCEECSYDTVGCVQPESSRELKWRLHQVYEGFGDNEASNEGKTNYYRVCHRSHLWR